MTAILSWGFVLPTTAVAEDTDPNDVGSLCQNGAGYLPKPVNTDAFPITSNMGPRNLKVGSKIHRGTDYATKCGTRIGGPPAGCKLASSKTTAQSGGYGNSLGFDCGNGIQVKYSHLATTTYNSNSMTTGSTGVGNACHLDYIVTIDNKVIDAQCATGDVRDSYTYGNSSVRHKVVCPASGPINLCDPTVREALKEHASNVLKNKDKEDFNIADGTTAPDGDDDHTGDSHDHSEDETGPGVVVVQGNDGLDGTGGVEGEDDPLEEPGPDPEEDDPTPPTPGDEYDPKASKPRCDNSTCITQDTIDNAKHKRVKYDKADPHWDFLKADGECKQPTKTGASVSRQIVGELQNYPDSFCTNQGCVYVNEGSGDGKCE